MLTYRKSWIVLVLVVACAFGGLVALGHGGAQGPAALSPTIDAAGIDSDSGPRPLLHLDEIGADNLPEGFEPFGSRAIGTSFLLWTEQGRLLKSDSSGRLDTIAVPRRMHDIIALGDGRFLLTDGRKIYHGFDSGRFHQGEERFEPFLQGVQSAAIANPDSTFVLQAIGADRFALWSCKHATLRCNRIGIRMGWRPERVVLFFDGSTPWVIQRAAPYSAWTPGMEQPQEPTWLTAFREHAGTRSSKWILNPIVSYGSAIIVTASQHTNDSRLWFVHAADGTTRVVVFPFALTAIGASCQANRLFALRSLNGQQLVTYGVGERSAEYVGC